jgi:NAD-dependent dihydropyrimidine dehydrogenase PreA subunit
MIELIDEQRCTNCNICVRICPTDVFDRNPEGPPTISRQDFCQTCFMCEAHCPEDAMYVAPMRRPAELGSPHLDKQRLLSEGYFGSYRARLGWGAGRTPPRTKEELLELSMIGPRQLVEVAEGNTSAEECE